MDNKTNTAEYSEKTNSNKIREINNKVKAQVQQNRLKYLLGILGMNFQSLNHTQCDEKWKFSIKFPNKNSNLRVWESTELTTDEK